METKKAHEIFKDYLRREKHRVTPERFEVLDAAIGYKGHFGADDLYIAMKNQSSNVSRATVYNTLELLTVCDLLSKRNFGDNITRYEPNIGKKQHDHLVCTNCGKIKEFSNPDIKEIVDKICNELNFEFSGYSFNIFGKCKNADECEYSENE